MALSYTSDELIESVLNLYSLPGTNPEGCTNSDILRHLSEAMKTRLIPDIIRMREDFMVVTTRTALTSNKMRIPSRAIGNRVVDVTYWDGATRTPLLYITRERLHNYSSGTPPTGFFLEGNYIRLVPDATNTTGYLEIAFYFRPGDLVVESSAAQITALSGSDATIATLPSGWTTANKFDVHSSESGAEIKVWGATCSVVSTTMTFSTAIDGSDYGTEAVEVGDWICLENEAVIPAVPHEVHPILVELAALQLAKAVETDTEALAIRFAEVKNYKESLKNLLFDRTEPKELWIRGNHGLLRARNYGW